MLVGGIVVGIGMFAIWIVSSHEGLAISLLMSAFFGGTVALTLYGFARLLAKKLPVAAILGIVAVVTLVMGLLGPGVSTNMHSSSEQKLYDELSEDDARAADWIERYQKTIPEEFQREDWRLMWMKARVREAKTAKNAGELRTVVNEVTGAKDEKALKPAKKLAVAALRELYDAGKAKMYTPAKTGSAPEFSVDDALRTAFGAVLEDLSHAKDANVHVAFTNTAELAPPDKMDLAIQANREDPEVLAQFPKKDAPVIDPGDAFSSSFDKRRRATFMTAMTESFSQVFDGQLLTLVPVETEADKKDKLLIEVSSRLYRVPDVFVYTSSRTGTKKVTGLLYSFEVEWRFAIKDREGKILYNAPPVISRPSDAQFSTEPGDPDWAPYSVMMDSAYYNYSREVTGRFGLVPPAQKAVFAYIGK